MKSSPNEANSEVFLCRANGEGSHNFRVCKDEAEVMAFYKEMFGEDEGGGIQGAIDHFRDADNWSNNGTAYECELYCATFEVWKVGAEELAFAPSATPANARAVAICREQYERRIASDSTTPMTEDYLAGYSEACDHCAEAIAATLPEAPQPATQRSEPVVQHLIWQVENGESFDRSVMLKALRSTLSETPAGGTAKVSQEMPYAEVVAAIKRAAAPSPDEHVHVRNGERVSCESVGCSGNEEKAR